MITILQSVSASSPDANAATTSPVDTTGATLTVITAAAYQASTYTISDNKGNTYTQLTPRSTPSTQNSSLWYCANPIVGSGHTFTISGTSSFPSIGVVVASGTAASPFESENGASFGAGSTSMQPGSVTPSEDGDLIISGLASNLNTGAVSVDSGFSKIDYIFNGQSLGGAIGWLVQGSAASVNPTWSYSFQNGVITTIAVFRPLSIPPGQPGSLMMMGMGN